MPTMWLAGIPVVEDAVAELIDRLREADLYATAGTLAHARDREARIVALEVTDREAILRVLEEAPDTLTELRATLLQEHVGRQREGL